jgi:nondiscriminating glutamyl-tRNA synthetase
MEKNMENNVRVRFAPSPTGTLHIGGARTALFNYLFAKRHNGKFILRIEDTDLNRSTDESLTTILNGLKWLGLDWDEGPNVGGEYGPYIQTKRLDIYRKYLNKLLDENKAYKCFCTKEELEKTKEKLLKEKKDPIYNRKCLHLSKEEIKKYEDENRPYTVRFKMPNKKIEVEDLVFGKTIYDANLLTDLIIWKSEDVPTYNFAVVIDDLLMKITHVLRGEGHFQNTPSQVAIYEALGEIPPNFAHLSTILGSDKKKLSKRDGATSVEEFKELGYLNDAVLNFISLLGWSPKDNKEILSKEEIIKEFDLKNVTKSPAVFDLNKLNFINSQYLSNLSSDVLYDDVLYFLKKKELVDKNNLNNVEYINHIKKIITICKTRVSKIDEIALDSEIFFKYKKSNLEPDALEIINQETTKAVLLKTIEKLENINELNHDTIKILTKEIQKELNVKGKNLFMPIRISLSYSTNGHGVYELLEILGTKESIKRINEFIKTHLK